MPVTLLDPKKGIFLKSVDSTNLYIKDPEIEPGQWVLSEKQTEGKGRGSNKWTDIGEEKIIFSGKVRFQNNMFPVSLISLFCGSSVLRSLHSILPEYAPLLTIKWPNDIYRSENKIAGILIESEKSGNDLTIFIGIGINIVGNTIPDYLQKAGFLLDNPPSKNFRTDLIYKMIEHLNRNLLVLMDGPGIEKEIEWIKKNSFLSGKTIRTKINDSFISGRPVGFSEKGFLIVETLSGEIIELFDTSPEFEVLK